MPDPDPLSRVPVSLVCRSGGSVLQVTVRPPAAAKVRELPDCFEAAVRWRRDLRAFDAGLRAALARSEP